MKIKVERKPTSYLWNAKSFEIISKEECREEKFICKDSRNTIFLGSFFSSVVACFLSLHFNIINGILSHLVL